MFSIFLLIIYVVLSLYLYFQIHFEKCNLEKIQTGHYIEKVSTAWKYMKISGCRAAIGLFFFFFFFVIINDVGRCFKLPYVKILIQTEVAK